MIQDLTFLHKFPFGSREASDGHRKSRKVEQVS